MGFIHLLIGFFTFWTHIGVQYAAIKNNEERREKSVYLGVRSIIQTLICAALTVGLLIGAVALVGLLEGEAALLFIFIIVGIVACLIGALSTLVQGVIGGLLYMIYQFRLNKRPIRWVALGVWIAAVVGMIVFVILYVTKYGL